MKKLIIIVALLAGCFMAARADHPELDVVILGDSNTSIGGDDCEKPGAWSYWFNELFAPRTLKSYARSGATWSNTSATKANTVEKTGILGNDNVIYNQILRLRQAVADSLQAEPDLILISAGTNDAWFDHKRPGLWDMDSAQAFADDNGFITGREPNTVTSLAESVRYCCEMLMESWPKAQIILLAPQQSTAFDHAKLTRAADIIEECGAQMAIATIRQDRLNGNYRARESKKGVPGRTENVLTYDGTHTNAEGARRAGRLVARMVEGVLGL